MLADELDYVVGVDTHRDRHTLAIVSSPNGGVVAQRSVRTSARGYAEAVRFAERHAPGARAWAIEGAGHYGVGLARHLSSRGETVIESGRGARDERRLRGKDDPLDAIRAARAALASETVAVPRMGRRREALRLLLVARRGAIDVRRRALVQLRSVIVTAPDRLRAELEASAARTAAARSLQPLPTLELLSRRRARDKACPAHARTAHPGRNQ
jgi:transposase